MSVTRKIALAQQIEEMRALVSENKTSLPARARRREINAGLAEERLRRQAGILATLEFCQANEADIRAYIASRKGEGE